MNGAAQNPFPPEPSPDFLKTVLARITREERRLARRRFAVSALVCGLSAAGVVPAYQLLRTELAASGFPQILALIGSDPEIVLAHWQDFALSLLELAPVAGSVAILTSLFMLLGSLRASARELKTAFPTATRA